MTVLILHICILFRLQLYDLNELKIEGDGNCQVSVILLLTFVLSRFL